MPWHQLPCKGAITKHEGKESIKIAVAMPVVQTRIFHQFEKTYSFIKLSQSIVFNKLYRSIVFIKLYRSMVPTGKSSDVLHLHITFCKSELECGTLLLKWPSTGLIYYLRDNQGFSYGCQGFSYQNTVLHLYCVGDHVWN